MQAILCKFFFLIFFFNIGCTIDKNRILNFDNIDKYKYKDIIFFYEKYCKLNYENILLAFYDLKNKGIAEEDLFLIDWNDFLIIFLEYSSFYMNKYMYLSIIDKLKNKVDDATKNMVDLILEKYENQEDYIFEGQFINKIKLYIDCKKNNKDYFFIVDSSYYFIYLYSHIL